jgi:hypothetical protein
MPMNRYAVILAAPGGFADDANTIAVASALAQRQDALVRVVATYAVSDAPAAVVGFSQYAAGSFTSGAVEMLEDDRAQARLSVGKLARQAAADQGLAWGDADTDTGPRMVLDEGGLSSVLALGERLPLADIAVFSALASQDSGSARRPFTETLMAYRTPVLIARGSELGAGGTVAIAWDGGAQAGRAVRAARPLLAEADTVLILQDASAMLDGEREAADPAHLIAYLRRCGIGGCTALHVEHGRDGHALAAAASAHHAKVLVAGAYCHTRLGEWAFGGATRALLETQGGPHLFMAH